MNQIQKPKHRKMFQVSFHKTLTTKHTDSLVNKLDVKECIICHKIVFFTNTVIFFFRKGPSILK